MWYDLVIVSDDNGVIKYGDGEYDGILWMSVWEVPLEMTVMHVDI